MTFNNSNPSRKGKIWEINRFANIADTVIVGGASKLFNYFINTYTPPEVLSYADMRWSTLNAVYKHLGMELMYISTPNLWYINGTHRIHRYSLRKNKDDDQSLTTQENRKLQGFNWIWDCGHAKWKWINKKPAI